MKTTDLMTKVSGLANKASFKLKKHSPEILIVAGTIGTIAAAVMACKATLKVNDTIDQAKNDIAKIHEATEKGCTEAGQEYSAEDSKKDLTIVYVQTGIKLAKMYAPSIALGTLSIASILTSNNILRKRNMALAAAYATVDKGFKEYRSRVAERFGEEIENQLRYNIQAIEQKETVVDENGEEITVSTVKNCIDPTDISGYARYFEEYTRDEKGNVIKNPHWESNNDYNLMFLKSQQRFLNDRLKARGRVFLNEAYEALGLPHSKAGQIVGWVYDPEDPKGDNYIDFGIFASNQAYSDFVYGNDPAILLDFNVDGNIWELMR